MSLADQENTDKMSRISVFGADVDEWDALNKYAIYKGYKNDLENQAKKRMAQTLIRQELDKQTSDFKNRKEAFRE